MIYAVLRNSLGGELDRHEVPEPGSMGPVNTIASTIAGLCLGDWSEMAIGDSIRIETSPDHVSAEQEAFERSGPR